ncbi:hypothetical protein BJ878DRAFT_480463 [Calycina marina]|uniref:Protein HRI1 n=1 Tax=Calycina marina TaxID=1763456 RepID=A0A9P8CEW7_9HELO|nr:hypothetical protein BJ878DRAFT_480463 [Calycina marina]
MGYADLSTRISIRWLPDAASEPTDTLVLNVGSYFMDFRVLKSDISIEWAFAGQREIISQDPLKCRWIHVIDSNGAPAVPDQGSFSKLPNGDDLEVGAMPCAEKNGEVTSYEEIWRVVKPSISPGQPLAWILQSSEDGKVFIGRIGGTYMAMVQTERGFGARREEWESESKKWKGKYAMGEVEGCASLVGGDGSELDGEEGWSVGCKVELKGTEYVVRAWEKLE